MAKILIFGAGSIGTYLGTLLFSKGHEVTLLGGDKVQKLHETILIDNSPYTLPPRLYTLKSNETFEYVFITSKLYDLERNLKLLLSHKIKFDYLAIVQNGLVEDKFYKPYLEGKAYTSISVFEGFRLIENQLLVSPSKTGWKTDDSVIGKKISVLLQSAGIRCTTDTNLESIKAEKTVINCSVNLLSAIEKKTLFELCNDPKTKTLVDTLFNESYAVLSNVTKLKDKEVLRKEFYEIFAPMRHYSSTYQDALSHRKTELAFLNEYILKLARKYHVPTPMNEAIVITFKRMYKAH